MGLSGFGRIVQLGYLVDDLDAAVATRLRQFNLGPWTIFRNTRLDGHYRGAATTVLIDVALAYQGDLQVELIKLRSGGPSPYATADGPILGLHHVASLVDDLDAAVALAIDRGLVPAFEAGNAAVRVAYLETGEPGVLHELIEGRDMAAMIAAGIEAARHWDGTQAVTEIDLAAG